MLHLINADWHKIKQVEATTPDWNGKPTHPYQEASLCHVLVPDIPVNLLPFSAMAVFSVSQVHVNYVVMCLRSQLFSIAGL